MTGYSARKDGHLTRLRRIEGQVRGLQRMVEEADEKVREASEAIARLVRS